MLKNSQTIPADPIRSRNLADGVAEMSAIVGQSMLARKAVHEAHRTAEEGAGELQGNNDLAAAAFNARVIPSAV